MAKLTVDQSQQERLDAEARREGYGGGRYASAHTASADPWYLVVVEDDIDVVVFRVQAPDAAFARHDVERRWAPADSPMKITRIAREEWVRL